MADEPFIHELLIRGHDPATGMEPSWHVEIATPHRDAAGALRHNLTMLNISQAEEAGWTESKVLAWIDTQLATSVERERTAYAELKAKYAEAEEKIAGLEARIAKETANG
jgi:hypothetical protein